jgi:hypothetical protein
MIKNKMLALAAVALLALPLAARPQSQEQLVDRYTTLAGSKQNATSLVTGLRDGKEVTLTDGKTTETFTPKTGKMGYGNIDNALALAQASLAKLQLTSPKPTALESALMGGKVTTKSGEVTQEVTLKGILEMRADGMGWGQIAQQLGFKLGEVKRSDKASPPTKSTERTARVERAARPDNPERPDRPDKPERPEKPR